MNAINFDGVNTIYTVEGYGDLPVQRSIDSKYKCLSLVSCWEPTDEEMEYIKRCIDNSERPKIFLDILSNEHPPVWVGCNIFEKGEEDGK